MNRRRLAAGIVLLAFVGLVAPAADVVHLPPRVRQGLSPPVFVLGVGVAALAALAALLAIARQYVRWEPYRPAIHLAAAVFAFVAALAWWLDSGTLGGDDPLTGRERRTIRVAGAGLLFFLLFSLARYFGGDETR